MEWKEKQIWNDYLTSFWRIIQILYRVVKTRVQLLFEQENSSLLFFSPDIHDGTMIFWISHYLSSLYLLQYEMCSSSIYRTQKPYSDWQAILECTKQVVKNTISKEGDLQESKIACVQHGLCERTVGAIFEECCVSISGCNHLHVLSFSVSELSRVQ